MGKQTQIISPSVTAIRGGKDGNPDISFSEAWGVTLKPCCMNMEGENILRSKLREMLSFL